MGNNAQVLMTMVTTAVMLCGVFVASRALFGAQARFEGYSFSDEAFTRNNPAVPLRFAGMMVGMLIAFVGAYAPLGQSMLDDLASGIFAFVCAAIGLMASRYISDHLILSNIDNNKAVVKDRNVAVAIVEAATYVATALIFAGGMHDNGSNLLYNIVWFLLGQALLVALGFGYSKVAPRVFAEIKKGNPAAALSLAGLLLSGGIAVSGMIRGEFESWTADLFRVAISLLIWIGLMVLAHLVSGMFLINRKRLAEELTTIHNWSVGVLDCLTFAAFTAAFVAIHAS